MKTITVTVRGEIKELKFNDISDLNVEQLVEHQKLKFELMTHLRKEEKLIDTLQDETSPEKEDYVLLGELDYIRSLKLYSSLQLLAVLMTTDLAVEQLSQAEAGEILQAYQTAPE
jgi:hypothetical protein